MNEPTCENCKKPRTQCQCKIKHRGSNSALSAVVIKPGGKRGELKTYVIMKEEGDKPMYLTTPMPHLIVGSLKEARNTCDQLNSRAAKNHYWFEKVKNTFIYDKAL